MNSRLTSLTPRIEAARPGAEAPRVVPRQLDAVLKAEPSGAERARAREVVAALRQGQASGAIEPLQTLRPGEERGARAGSLTGLGLAALGYTAGMLGPGLSLEGGFLLTMGSLACAGPLALAGGLVGSALGARGAARQAAEE
jgi:hypothetical protein